MKISVRTGTMIALVLAAAAPVAAQMPPGAPAIANADGRMHGRAMFPALSEAGRTMMMEAMRAGGDRRTERQSVAAARDRMLTLLEADRLDTAALKQALDDERNAANASRERHQAAMLAGFTKLSVADRKAFVADARAMKTRMAARMQGWRGRHGHMPDDASPPSPPTM